MAVTESRRGKDQRTGALEAPVEAATGRGGILCIALTANYLLAMAVVCVAIRAPGIVPSGNETTWDRSIFTSVNAATLTGFQQTMGIREMAAAGAGGPVLLFALTVLGSLTSLFVGGMAGARVLRMPHTVGQIALAAITAEVIAVVAGAAALVGPGTPIFDALLQAASAFGNSGLWTGAYPPSSAPSSYLVLLPLTIVGGLGLPVLIEATNTIFGKATLSRHSQIVLVLTGVAYLIGLVVLVLAQSPVAAGGGWPAWRDTLASCTMASINTRTAGLPFQSPAAFTAAGQWLLMLLMIVGASPAGTAGGLKLTTLWQLFRGTGDVLGGRPAHRATGIAAVWLGIYTAALLIGVILLVQVQSQIPADRLLFLAVSALSNVGLSHDPVSITGPGLLVLSALMLIGRLVPMAILWWMARTTQGAQVLVG
jgi:Trk-type K+ transport system membrane component